MLKINEKKIKMYLLPVIMHTELPIVPTSEKEFDKTQKHVRRSYLYKRRQNL